MNDSIFNTLAAVALMCSSHFHEGFVFQGRQSGGYDIGFEQCGVIVKELDAEKERRAKEAAAKVFADEKARIANVLAALHGKKFTPEPAPALTVPTSWGMPCIIPASTVNVGAK